MGVISSPLISSTRITHPELLGLDVSSHMAFAFFHNLFFIFIFHPFFLRQNRVRQSIANLNKHVKKNKSLKLYLLILSKSNNKRIIINDHV